MLDRREFLARSGRVAAAGALGGLAVGPEEPRRAPAVADGWDAVRDAFAVPRDLHHLTAFLLAPHPRPVREAIERHRRALDADPAGTLERSGALDEAVRAEAAAYLGGTAADVALVHSTTMGLGLVYGGLRLRAGQELLTTAHDHYSTHEALRLRAVRSGARLRRVTLYRRLDRVSEEEIVRSLLAAVTPRTRVVAITWVHSSTGLKLPVRRIAAELRRLNARRPPAARALLCVDAVHALGVEADAAAGLGADVVVAGGHKWLWGPRGTGVVWARPGAWAALRPTVPSFAGGSYGAWIQGVAPGPPDAAAMSPGGFHAYEHRWALADAFAFHRRLGRAAVARRTHALAAELKDGLAGIRGVRLRTPRSTALSAGLVVFDVDGRDAGEVVERLAGARVVASVTPYRRRSVRLGPSLVNGPEDVEAALRAVRAAV